MRTHFILTLLALSISACATRQDHAENTKTAQDGSKYSFADGAYNRFR